MMRGSFSALVLALALAGAIVSARADATEAAAQGSAQGIPDQQVSTMKIRIDLEGTAMTATLVDNETSRGFCFPTATNFNADILRRDRENQ
jgi:hypothetical protein